jgi:hypothetical protein
MIYSLHTVSVVHGKMNEYTEFVAKELIPIYQRLGIKMIGSWRTSIGGNSDECVLLFAWDSMAQMEKLQAVRNADKEWQRVLPRYQPLTTSNTINRILEPNAYSTLK